MATNDITKVGIARCWASHSRQLGVEVLEKKSMRKYEHRCCHSNQTPGCQSFCVLSSWRETSSRTGVCHTHHWRSDSTGLAAGNSTRLLRHHQAEIEGPVGDKFPAPYLGQEAMPRGWQLPVLLEGLLKMCQVRGILAGAPRMQASMCSTLIKATLAGSPLHGTKHGGGKMFCL